MRAIDVGMQIVQLESVDGGIRRFIVEVRGLHQRDLAPRSQRRRRDIGPRLSTISRQVDDAVVRTRPDSIQIPE